MNLSFKTRIQVIRTYLLCSLIFVKNLLFAKKLIVEKFLYTNNIVIQGNEAELNWEIKGCHKISIKDIGILQGNISYINLKLIHKINPIEITFYGVGGQKEVKNIIIKTSSPSILNSFKSNTNIPNITSIPFTNQDLKNKLIDIYQYKEPIRVNFKDIETVSPRLQVKFEPFTKTNYPIK